MTAYFKMDCAVCFNDMQNDAPPEKMQKTSTGANSTDICCTPCGHVFHKKCLTNWFQKEHDASGLVGNAENGTCPTCRSKVNISTLYPIYFPANSSSRSSLTQKTSSNQPLTSNQNTTANKSDVVSTLELLKKDLESMRDKWLAEKDRADLNQAIINSLTNSNATDKDRKDSRSQPNDEQNRGQSSTTSGYFNFGSGYIYITPNDDTNNSNDEENIDDDDDEDDDFI